jgi:aspartate kinase
MLIVQKFGGTSVADLERIRAVAKRALATHRSGHDVVVVVSAMAGETNRLLRLATDVWDDTADREVDVIISTGEQTSGLMALAIRELGGNARSFLGHQIPIRTDTQHGRARIQEIAPSALGTAVRRGKIAVVAGFQGVDEEGNITTLGRGGSDTTAVAIAAALKADVCEIYTDVAGVYIPTWCRPRARSTASRTRRCWSCPRWAPRCCSFARSSSA